MRLLERGFSRLQTFARYAVKQYDHLSEWAALDEWDERDNQIENEIGGY